MHDARSPDSRTDAGKLRSFAARTRFEAPTLTACGVAIVSALLLTLSFPDFNLWPLAWLSLVPLFLVIARKPAPWPSFLLGWLFGVVFFYGSCYWLTYSMIHTGGLSSPLAFLLLIPGALVLGLFPGSATFALGHSIKRLGLRALLLAPIFWETLEWARLEITGQLWNAIGYSQAYHPSLIQSARWGGVYGVGFLIVSVNAAIALVVLKHDTRTLVGSAAAIAVTAIIAFTSYQTSPGEGRPTDGADAVVAAIQPNVPMELFKPVEEMRELTARHIEMSESALRQFGNDVEARLVIWPESPMNFAYGGDLQLQQLLTNFAKKNKTSVLLNSQEIAPNDGLYNSALLINREGKLIAQYDKIRLLPFGEYVPLPRWLPGAGLITAIVGDFTPGTNYPLMPVGKAQAGVFICIESAYPWIARRFTREGADVLINISNDGYLGPTAVMKQHLANAVFRAVENGRPVLRVTNTGITARVTPRGELEDATQGFQPAVRTWSVARTANGRTFYTVYGDLFVACCAVFSILVLGFSFSKRGHKPIAIPVLD